ncbi:MAG TPA: type II toxin-antitoxin system VapC family toxin [Terriglobales bacterium]|nr:type II toxin-antitoxin system VapC family toxin [Terriglobales bacterium]
MKILLDTHAFLWWIRDDPRLSRRARELVTSGRNELFLSVTCVWEILTKTQTGKLRLAESAQKFVTEQLTANNIQVLPLTLDHVFRLEQLPLHHRDPFDRILIAQSLEEEFPILSADPLLKNYSATLLW